MNKRILLTGGGSAGHVTPNVALLPDLRKEGFELHYIGMADSIEQQLMAEQKDVTFHTIESGKFRRYFSIKNLTDPFKVLKGISQAKRIINNVNPNVVFSKGGFVSVPVVIAAKGKCPVICHESDYTPGLANRIAGRFADKICVTFEDTLKCSGKKSYEGTDKKSHSKTRKKPHGAQMVHTGTPIRRELFKGDRRRGLDFLGFDGEKPVILVMGGSLGAVALNDGIRGALGRLTKQFDIVHLCGKGKVDESISMQGYRQYEYIGKELPDLLAATTLVVSRAGANAVFEFLALGKPALLVPLPLEASRGDQILNAEYVRKKGYAMVLPQEEITPEVLFDRIMELYLNRDAMIERMRLDPTLDGTKEVLSVIRESISASEQNI
ncbi:MAG: undecaprenyldiphospho-muramoylpentapeptide beta-N-acetylglucosaminyltransferase [Christensenellaceae bacterium]|nr:undecaprenyldiphospho-muramoylpentapeptide beta-N-acetylglucosaminyltransferase [Christensenellaceae bacterium]